jgi:hypothetical protein
MIASIFFIVSPAERGRGRKDTRTRAPDAHARAAPPTLSHSFQADVIG